ncbi:hypothetical protein [Nocardioides pyridinolyticus]
MFKKRRHEPEPVEVNEPVHGHTHEHTDGNEDDTEVRTLRAQVRVLEKALERIVDPPDLESYRTQVRAAVQAVALGTAADGDPRAAVARVAAAIARIDAPPTGRTLLPSPATVARPVAQPVARPVAVEAQPELAPVAATEPEVVLPVPPPAPVEDGRTRRRRGRTAA